MNLHDHLQAARRKLENGNRAGDLARLEAEILLAHALDAPRSFLYAHSDLELPRQRGLEFQSLVKRRAQGEPIAYLTGTREFWSLPLKITPDVLIPRPETELLVETALENLPQFEPIRVADIGTGSGAIALAIASDRPDAELHGTDICQAAIKLARENASSLGLLNVAFHTGSWCQPLEGKFHLIASNPPYIAEADPHLKKGDCRFEPPGALTPGADGLEAFYQVAKQAKGKLHGHGCLVFEHGFEQGDAVLKILAEYGFQRCETRRDLAGQGRISLGFLSD